MVDDEVQCRIGVAKLSQRMQQGRHPRIARVNRCGTEPSVSAQASHVWAKFHRGWKMNERAPRTPPPRFLWLRLAHRRCQCTGTVTDIVSRVTRVTVSLFSHCQWGVAQEQPVQARGAISLV